MSPRNRHIVSAGGTTPVPSNPQMAPCLGMHLDLGREEHYQQVGTQYNYRDVKGACCPAGLPGLGTY